MFTCMYIYICIDVYTCKGGENLDSVLHEDGGVGVGLGHLLLALLQATMAHAKESIPDHCPGVQ
jgi:hypothetical protein